MWLEDVAEMLSIRHIEWKANHAACKRADEKFVGKQAERKTLLQNRQRTGTETREAFEQAVRHCWTQSTKSAS